MATLIVEHGGHRKAAVLNGRVVIGRRANSHIVVPDRSVSRIHAWIGKAQEQFFIADSGSRVGTQVNGQSLHGRKVLDDGDEIKIGSALIRFHSNGTLPDGAEPLDLSDRPTAADDGIFVDCACGAPLWAPWDFAGRMGQCRYCGQMVEMPQSPEGRKATSDPSNDTVAPGMPVATTSASRLKGIRLTPAVVPSRPRRHTIFDAPIAPPASVAPELESKTDVLCGACQSPISLLEEVQKCAKCGVSFHQQCWLENRGCSSYGCSQVGILDPDRDKPKGPPAPQPEDLLATQEVSDSSSDKPAVEWDYLFLPISLMAALVGMISFGIPALAAAVAAVIYQLPKRRISHPNVVAASALLSMLAAMAGFALSWYWWFAAPSGFGFGRP